MTWKAAAQEQLSGWGRYPRCAAQVVAPLSFSQCATAVAGADRLIARGMGRSYGDSSLASCVLDTRRLDHLLDFDELTGQLTCAAGVTFDEILRVFVPKGWFVPVVPGTRYVTVGGAVASDVHGKNHHVVGSFAEHIIAIELLLGDGTKVKAARDENPELFAATCGGMGLTGLILTVTFRLKAVSSSLVEVTTVRAPDLEATLRAFADHADATYSVAWIDCCARGRSLGRAVLQLGEHAVAGGLTIPSRKRQLVVPDHIPSGLLNRYTVAAFNALYYRRAGWRPRATVGYQSFFFPLDALGSWPRLYGKAGFCQYQLVLPLDDGASGLQAVLERVAGSGLGSFLAVLKLFGRGNANYLSFPLHGYTLALDFKNHPAAHDLMDELDRIVHDRAGRLYLTKDARASVEVFRAGYPRWEQFEQVRAKWHAIGKFASVQSQRLGLQ